MRTRAVPRILVFLLPAALSVQPPAAAIAGTAAAPLVDGEFADWTDVPVAAEFAPAEDAAGPQLVRLRAVATDRRFVFLLELDREAHADDLPVEFLFDADADAATGVRAGDLGADFTWLLRRKEGRVYVWDLPVRVRQGTLGLRRAPTVSSDRFEVSFSRDASAAGAPVFPGGPVNALVRAGAGGAARESPVLRFPARSAARPEPPPEAADLSRRDPGHLRVLSYNVLFDGLFKRTDPFRRILRAIDPDVVVFQEIFEHTPQQTAELMADILPGTTWSFAGARAGVVLSRIPIDDTGPTGGAREGFWVRLASREPAWPEGLVILSPHPPCCENEAGRQDEIDAAMAWWRDERASGRATARTPLVIAGDMNLVGSAAQLQALLEGGVADTAKWGPPFPPDADGTALTDPTPRHTTGRESYTWRGDEGSFAPGRLDFILYSDALLAPGNTFVLWTPEMSQEELRARGLEREDTAVASDHLPVVLDLAPRETAVR